MVVKAQHTFYIHLWKSKGKSLLHLLNVIVCFCAQNVQSYFAIFFFIEKQKILALVTQD